jgi:hypothetical protein
MLQGALGQKTYMPVFIKQSDWISLIYLDGAITIPSATELKLVILQGLASEQKLSFHLQEMQPTLTSPHCNFSGQ